MAATFHLSVITPEKAVLEAEATFVAIPAWDGEIGILAHRAPLLAKLGVGWLRADTAQGKHAFLIDGGFAQVVDNKVSVLTEKAQTAAEIDPAAARAALERAMAMKITDEASSEARTRAISLARLQIKAAQAA
jgi:F-type H+-transporting ATPase subunit epsilon